MAWGIGYWNAEQFPLFSLKTMGYCSYGFWVGWPLLRWITFSPAYFGYLNAKWHLGMLKWLLWENIKKSHYVDLLVLSMVINGEISYCWYLNLTWMNSAQGNCGVFVLFNIVSLIKCVYMHFEMSDFSQTETVILTLMSHKLEDC